MASRRIAKANDRSVAGQRGDYSIVCALVTYRCAPVGRFLQPQFGVIAALPVHDENDFLDLFEARYGDQIHRCYDELSEQSMIQSDPLPDTDDPPF